MKPNITILIAITLAIMAGSYWYFRGDENQSSVSAIPLENQTQTQFQTLVIELQPISFATTIFSDPRFMALVDLATPIEPETAGRVDPFAPISNASGSVGTNTR